MKPKPKGFNPPFKYLNEYFTLLYFHKHILYHIFPYVLLFVLHKLTSYGFAKVKNVQIFSTRLNTNLFKIALK